jgi:hypothetical protein
VSDTPRTDANAQFFGFNPDEGEEFVQIDFARELERENAALRAALEREREWVLALIKDNGILLQAADSTNAGALAVSQSGRIETLEEENAALRADKERLDWIARNRSVSATERPLSVTPESLRESIDAARKEIQS